MNVDKMTQNVVNIGVRLRERVSGRMYSANNRSYDGDITVGDRIIRYELRFSVPIERLDELARENPDFAVQQIHLVVTDEEGCPLDDRARNYFMGIIPPLAIEHYFRDSVIPECLERARTEGSSEIQREYSLAITPELERILAGR